MTILSPNFAFEEGSVIAKYLSKTIIDINGARLDMYMRTTSNWHTVILSQNRHHCPEYCKNGYCYLPYLPSQHELRIENSARK